MNRTGPGRLQLLLLYGTRPEAIKMAPLVAALRRRPDRFALTVCTTAQHREMLDQVERVFGLSPDLDLGLMRDDQSLNELASRAIAALDPVLAALAPDWLLVQGDTTTAMAGALAAFHRGVKVGPVEAGLRTGDLAAPFPEEANRRIADLLAAACFAPTEGARRRLVAEGVAAERIHVTGNTVIDALEHAARLAPGDAQETAGDEVLVTFHRRESFGAPLAGIAAAIAELARAFPAVRWVVPVHRNPSVGEPVRRLLGGLGNVELHEPFDYLELVRRLRRSLLVVTDSGGLQEEAPTFGCPVVLVRERTDRPEAVAAGCAVVAGTSRPRIVAAVSRLLTDGACYRRMSAAASPYGDGRAAERIVAALAGERYEPFRAEGVAVSGESAAGASRI